ncbi:hypothetical protein MRX96_030126 [Rhipicephalus microplus]
MHHQQRTPFLQPSRPAPPFEPLLRRPPPPPGFSPFLVGQQTQKLMPLPTHQGPAMPGAGNGLAELCALPHRLVPVRTTHHTCGGLHSSETAVPPPWGNSGVPDMPWIAQDPAILSGGSLSDATNMAARF